MPFDRKQLSELDSFLYTLQQNIFTEFGKTIYMQLVLNSSP